MAMGRRSSIYYDDELRAALTAAREVDKRFTASELLRQRLGLSPLDERVPLCGGSPVRVSRGGPSAGVVRERVRLRGEGLKVVAPEARLPVDRNAGTPRTVFQPPPDAYHPPVPDDDDE